MSDLENQRVKGWLDKEKGLYIDFASPDEFLYFAAWTGTLDTFKQVYAELYGDADGATDLFTKHKNSFNRKELMRIVNTTKLSDGRSLREELMRRLVL